MRRLIKIHIVMLCFICIFSGCSTNGNNPSEDTNTFLPTDTTSDIDLADYFQGINGSMVIYNEFTKEYGIYNPELSEKRSSPCSTFKIVSALIGLNENILESSDTLIAWNGVKYPVDEWNGDLTLKQAFRSSCVWYFKNVIDRAGKEAVNKTLNELSYGNCDTSQWEGSNANQNYDELNGFWLESSLLISPKEQVNVLIQIFSEGSDIDEKSVSTIKDIMKIDNANDLFSVYGKTGTGIKEGRCVDAWFIGIAESSDSAYYFALKLDDPDNDDVSGQKAKEIALSIIDNYL